MFVYYNPNPVGRTTVGDCAIRAVSKALDVDWEKAYAMIVVNGFRMGDVVSSNSVWGSVLRMNGFRRENLPNTCPDCYTVREFCKDHPKGTYVLGLQNHTVTAISGNWFDTWDCGDETVLFYWTK
jgi:hypothetical protein